MAQAGKSFSTATINPEYLRKLSLEELGIFLDAAKFATDAWLAVANQPRAACKMAVHSVLEDEWERCNLIYDAIFDEAQSRKPKTADDIEKQAVILCKRMACGGEWRAVVDVALTAALAQEAHMAVIRQKAA